MSQKYKKNISLFGGIFFSFVILDKVYYSGISLVGFNFFILAVMIFVLLKMKFSWLFESMNDKKKD